MANNTITGRVIRTISHGTTVYGNPMLSVVLDEYTGPGVYGILAVPRSEGAFHCYECRRSWNEETPAGRCPWEYQHGETTNVRMTNNSMLAYAIDNSEFKDQAHTFILTAAGRIRSYQR